MGLPCTPSPPPASGRRRGHGHPRCPPRSWGASEALTRRGSASLAAGDDAPRGNLLNSDGGARCRLEQCTWLSDWTVGGTVMVNHMGFYCAWRRPPRASTRWWSTRRRAIPWPVWLWVLLSTPLWRERCGGRVRRVRLPRPFRTFPPPSHLPGPHLPPTAARLHTPRSPPADEPLPLAHSHPRGHAPVHSHPTHPPPPPARTHPPPPPAAASSGGPHSRSPAPRRGGRLRTRARRPAGVNPAVASAGAT